jgi:hypothetical protein
MAATAQEQAGRSGSRMPKTSTRSDAMLAITPVPAKTLPVSTTPFNQKLPVGYALKLLTARSQACMDARVAVLRGPLASYC